LVSAVFITFEGVEGSGKTTQARQLASVLSNSGRGVRLTREPDGTALGAAIRKLFETDPTPVAEVFLFLAARHQHVAEVIRPALARGEIVVSDRYTDATLAYQGYGRRGDVHAIRELNRLATEGLAPDLTVLLDLDAAAGMQRIRGRAHDAFERLGLEFHGRVRQGYLEIAREEKDRVLVVSGDQPETEVAAAILAGIRDRLGGRLDAA
jgi:dTMP kinase